MIKGGIFDFVPMKPTTKGISTNIYYSVFLRDIEVGYILLENYDFKTEKAEIAYKVYKPFRRKGIATQMVKEFINVIPEYFNLSFFDAKVNVDNDASCKVLEKAGFNEKTIEVNPFEERISGKRYFFRNIKEETIEANAESRIEELNLIISDLKRENLWG